jgi:hypothetical protein
VRGLAGAAAAAGAAQAVHVLHLMRSDTHSKEDTYTHTHKTDMRRMLLDLEPTNARARESLTGK